MGSKWGTISGTVDTTTTTTNTVPNEVDYNHLHLAIEYGLLAGGSRSRAWKAKLFTPPIMGTARGAATPTTDDRRGSEVPECDEAQQEKPAQ